VRACSATAPQGWQVADPMVKALGVDFTPRTLTQNVFGSESVKSLSQPVGLGGAPFT